MVLQTTEIKRIMDNPSARLQALMGEEGLNQVELAEKVGKTKSLISKYLNPDEKPSDIFLRTLEDKFGWSARWIRTGEGPKRVSYTPPNQTNQGRDASSPYNLIDRGSSARQNMWWVPAKAQAGFIRGFSSRVFPSMIERGTMPMIQGECFAFEIEGFSMYPDYVPGAFVVCTTLEDVSWLRKGKVYVFQADEGLIIKIFDRLEGNMIYMTAANPAYNPVEPLSLSELRQLYTIEFDMMKPKR